MSRKPKKQTADLKLRLQEASRLIERRKLVEAKQVLLPLARANPELAPVHRLLGLCFFGGNELILAKRAFHAAIKLNPKDDKSRAQLANVLVNLDDPEGAFRVAAPVLERDPENELALLAKFGACFLTDRLEDADQIIAHLRRVAPDNGDYAFKQARTAQSLGREEEAHTLMQQAYDMPGCDRLLALLFFVEAPGPLPPFDIDREIASLGTGENYENGIERLTALKSALLMRRGDFPSAFDLVSRRNAQNFVRVRDDTQKHMAHLQAYVDHLRACPVLLRDASNPVELPVRYLAIAGPSRSGKTTLEKVLARHDAVQAAGEARMSGTLIRGAAETGLEVSKPNNAWTSDELSAAKSICTRLLDAEFELGKMIIETTPATLNRLAFLLSVMANARAVFVQRDLEDLVYRQFMYLYQAGNTYALDLDTARQNAKLFHQAQTELLRIFPDQVAVVSYEDMVEDTAKALQPVEGLLGLKRLSTYPELYDDRGFARNFKQT